MAGPIQKVSVVLNGGIDERSANELAGPTAQQGASLTLRRSENTRLSTKPGTTTRAPEAELGGSYGNFAGFAGAEMISVVSAEANKSSLVFLRRDDNRRIGVDSTTSGPGAGGMNPVSAPAAATIPAHIADAGSAPGTLSSQRVVSAVVQSASGGFHLYHAYLAYPDPAFTASESVFVYVTDTDGALLVTPQMVLDGSTTPNAISQGMGITSHNDDEATIWIDTTAGTFAFTVAGLTSQNDFTVGALAPVTGPLGGEKFQVCGGSYVDHTGGLVTTNRQYAYLVSGAGSATIYRVDTAAAYASITGSTIAGAVTSLEGSLAVFFGPTELGDRLIVAYAAAALLTVEVYNPALVLQSAGSVAAAPAYTGVAVSVAWETLTGLSSVVVALGEQATVGADPRYGTAVFASALSPINLVRHNTVAGMAPVGQGGQIRFGAQEMYPAFELSAYYGPDNLSLVDPDFVGDPDVQLWVYRGVNACLAPVARYGCVRGTSAPAASPSAFLPASKSAPLFFGGQKLWVSYPVQTDVPADAAPTLGRKSRWVLVDLAPQATPRTLDRDGTALTAAALPIEWDGVCPAELGSPLNAPKLYTMLAGGGVGFPNDTYVFAAVVTWVDGAGKKHRSSPGLSTVTVTAAQPLSAFVYAPNGNLRGAQTSSAYTCELYFGRATDATLTRMADVGTPGPYGWYFGTLVDDDVVVQIYSTGTAGEEQTPQPPPPLKDITIIGDRAWGIDAEQPSRLVHSKRRVAGIGYEWYPGYEVLLPSGAGAAVAVREWQGAVAVFAERAIFIVSGDGPDNLVGNPSGGGFSKPQKVSDLGCTNTHSVVSSPAGILFQRDDEILLFAGGPPKSLAGPVVVGDIAGAAVFQDADEVVLFEASRQLVWNYAVGRWTTWNLIHPGYFGSLITREVSKLAYDRTKLQVVDARDGDFGLADALFLVDSEGTSDLAMTWETDWVILGGDFQDHVFLQHLVFSARRFGPHGVTVEIFTDYNDNASTTRSWDDTELEALSSDTGRYTIKVQATNRGTRAVKIRLTETGPIGTDGDGQGMEPVALTLYYNIEANLMEPAIKPGSFR